MKAFLDLHQLGRQQTGNETWARNIGLGLLHDPGDDQYESAVTAAAYGVIAPGILQGAHYVSGSSARRLLIDAPRVMRRAKVDVGLFQYSMPVTRIPCVVAVHDLSFEHPRSHEWLPLSTRLRYRATIRASVSRAAHVLALSEHTRRDLISHYDVSLGRISVVGAAVDPDLVEVMRGIKRPHSVQQTVLIVGNVLPRKNLVPVAQAVALMRARGRDVTMKVIGSVPRQGQAIARTLKDTLGDAVSITGYLNTEALAEAYRTAGVFAFPSLYEGFGIPLLEAMAAELPVACSTTSCLPEIAGDAATLVDAEGVDAWAEALDQLLTDDGLRRERTAAGSRRAAAYSWASSVASVRADLRFVAANGGVCT